MSEEERHTHFHSVVLCCVVFRFLLTSPKYLYRRNDNLFESASCLTKDGEMNKWLSVIVHPLVHTNEKCTLNYSCRSFFCLFFFFFFFSFVSFVKMIIFSAASSSQAALLYCAFDDHRCILIIRPVTRRRSRRRRRRKKSSLLFSFSVSLNLHLFDAFIKDIREHLFTSAELKLLPPNVSFACLHWSPNYTPNFLFSFSLHLKARAVDL